MLNFKEARLEKLAVHYVGNLADSEGMNLSQNLVDVDNEVKSVLKTFFLKSFKEQGLYTFHHESDLNLNEAFHYAKTVFSNPDSLLLQSINLARHLYECSSHPMIKSGELYVAYFSDCVINGEVTEVLGLFKSENRETYLKVFPANGSFEVQKSEGISINKLDKGCLIFNTEKETGYRVAVIDNTNKNNEAQYWKNKFLKVKPNEDSYYVTQNYLALCKEFAEEAFPEADKVDKIDLVNNSISYFSRNDSFNIKSFEEEVMQEPEIIEKFQKYKNSFKEEENVPVFDEFEISKPALKQSKRYIRSVIKLDKNFHVYVHGNRQNIIRGFDEQTGLNTYTLYFKEES